MPSFQKYYTMLIDHVNMAFDSPLPGAFFFPLQDVGLGGKATRDGIKLLGRGVDNLKQPLNIEVTSYFLTPTPFILIHSKALEVNL